MSSLSIVSLLNSQLPYYLSFARICLILSITFAVLCICCKRKQIKKETLRIIAVIQLIAIVLGCTLFLIWSNEKYYNKMVDETVISSRASEIEKLYPYHSFEYKENVEFSNIVVIKSAGTSFLSLSSYSGYIENPDGVYYYVNYIEGFNPYINLRFYIEEGTWITRFRYGPFSYVPEIIEEMKIDGVKAKVFVVQNQYIVFVDGFGKSISASLLCSEKAGITPQAFAEEVVNQFQLIEKAVDEDIFIQ